MGLTTAMAPLPEEKNLTENETFSKPLSTRMEGDEVVISGMSGSFPKSDSTFEFMENLYNKVDMVSEETNRWVFNHPEVPKFLGQVNDMGKFDAQFFRVHYKQACTIEPMSRKLLEHAYSAIYDSGINPLQLRGQKVGVFIGSTFSESERIVIYETIQRNGFGITGCNKAMYANRISYWIDGKGPSYALDIACASSMACLEHAYRCISTGQCDAAIVGGCNLTKHPHVSLNFKRAGFLCLDGKTKCFDKNADGYVRADAMSVLFLQRAKDAKRIYSEVYHAASQFSEKPCPDFLPIREPEEIQQFLEQFYAGLNISPSEIEYIEANGAALAKADGNELEAIGQVFGKEKPVKVGSVKSNMGNSEPASGVCALTKVCLAYHKGQLPANLHYSEPQDQISSVRDGKVEILQDHVPFNRGYAALNSFSYSGVNVHVLLKGHYKAKDDDRYKTSIPQLVLASGRQESCVNKILNTLKSKPIDPEQLGLLNNIHEFEIPGHMCRGYSILDSNDNGETVCLTQKMDYFTGESRPIWFVYSGMGSQWAGMGAELMKIPTFAAAIQRCHKALEPKGINITKILTEPDKTIYDNILNSFVGIAAVQIGLTDVLREMGIVPDKIIGHSVGELGCAYADGCFTAEEMILSAYSRGLVSVQTPFIHGYMAAVGLGYKAILDLCPPEIEVACHNSSESSTISGPADIMKKFVTKLSERGIFAKEVPCSNIAYHSRYIAKAGPGLLKYLSEVITDPKLRSEKWVSSSVPQDKWDQPSAKYSSAEYHTNNLLNSVLFEETARLIPNNALCIEIAPHGLLQAILKRSHSSCIHVPLTRRGHSNPVQMFLEATGKLYQEGLNPKVSALYPKIEYPVSTETGMLSHLVEWEHSENWPEGQFSNKDRVTTTVREFVMSIHDDDYKYFEDHVREGYTVFPEAAILVLLWETEAMQQEVDYRKQSIIFHNVQFHGEAHIKKEEPLRLQIMINKGDRKFEVSHNKVTIVTGTITASNKKDVLRPFDELKVSEEDDDVLLTSEEVYKILRLRGYSYKNEFESIRSSNSYRNQAKIKWNDEWVTFLDSLLQFNALNSDNDGISIPKVIRKIIIDVEEHERTKIMDNNTPCYEAKLTNTFNITRCGGVEINDIVLTEKPRVEKEPDVLESQSFIPHFLNGEIDMQSALHINMQIIVDNIPDDKITIGIDPENVLKNPIQDAINKLPLTKFEMNSIKSDFNDLEKYNLKEKNINVFVVERMLTDEKKMKTFYESISKNAMILSYEENYTKILPRYKNFNVITAMSVQKKTLVLFNKTNVSQNENRTYIPVAHDKKFSWVPRVQSELKKTRKVVLFSERQTYCGLLGMIKILKNQYPNKIDVVVVDDYLVPSFNPESTTFKDQLEKNLAVNVLKKGQWGGYYYLPADRFTKHLNVKLDITVPGDMDSLTWTEAHNIPASNTRVQVCFAGPSFRDAQKAVSKSIFDDYSFGMDFSGIDYKGDRVMGAISGGAIATTIEANEDLLWPVPEYWSLEDAATMPLPYLHAYYCLSMKYPIIKGEKIFINGGSGAFGQAVISICLALNCTVFTTVSNKHKKEFLLRRFPELKEENITCSRHDTFYNMVLNNTRGKRCQRVISTYSGERRISAMKCVGFSGIFLDVSDADMRDNKNFGMSYLCEDRNYVAVNLSNLFKPENHEQIKALQLKLAEGIATGIVKPISRVVYTFNEVSKAFRLLSTSRHRGRVLLRMRDPVTSNLGIAVKPILAYSSTNTYVIICDKDGLGIELADRLVNKGAKKLIIHIKSEYRYGYFHTKLTSWRKQNVSVVISTENLHTEKGCFKLLKEGEKLGTVQGIFIVQDNSNTGFEQDNFVKKFDETGLVVANFDYVSRSVCAELKYFVVLAPVANSVVDAHAVALSEKICQARNEVGLPASVLHVNHNINQSSKLQLQPLSTLFYALETSLKLKHNNVISFNLNKQYNAEHLQKIAKILGVDKLDDLSENLTLRELDITDVNIEEIKTVLKDVHNIVYPSEIILQMTFVNIKNTNAMKTKNTKFDSGLGAFYTYVDEDECLATEPMIPMPTKLSNATEKEEDLDPKETYLMLFPGFEGHHQIFPRVCERLKIQAMTFQLGPDLPTDSIQDIALNILKFIKTRFELKSKFYLLGYSFGVNVALELAALIEKEGHVGVVYCLDSSPDSLRVQLDAYIGNLSESQLQDAIIEHLYALMAGEQSSELKEDLSKLDEWSAKVEACVYRIRGLVHYSHQYKRSILETAYRRIKLSRQYKPEYKLNSEIVLMKGIPHPRAEKLPEDYNLSKYTKQPVKIFNLESDHALAPFDCRVSNIVNKFLDPQLLESYKNKNLCESYLADPFKIL